jgi:dipeptidase D
MNAIAKDATAVIACAASDIDALTANLEATFACIKKEFARTDPDMFITINPVAVPATAMSPAAQEKHIAFIDLLFDGAYMYYNEAHTMAKTSCNIGILETVDGSTVATCLMRSNSNYEMDQLIRKACRTSALLGVKHIVKDRSGAWEGDGTPLIARVAELYEQQFGEKPTFTQAHGGVEIGTILGLGERVGRKMYAVNFGATSEAVHTTRERLHIPGMQQGYAWLQHVLVNLD